MNGTSSSPVAYLEGLYNRKHVQAVSPGNWSKRFPSGLGRWATRISHPTRNPENLVSQAVHAKLGFVETERAVFFSKPLDIANDDY